VFGHLRTGRSKCKVDRFFFVFKKKKVFHKKLGTDVDGFKYSQFSFKSSIWVSYRAPRYYCRQRVKKKHENYFFDEVVLAGVFSSVFIRANRAVCSRGDQERLSADAASRNDGEFAHDKLAEPVLDRRRRRVVRRAGAAEDQAVGLGRNSGERVCRKQTRTQTRPSTRSSREDRTGKNL
jgi:hypothetical protein